MTSTGWPSLVAGANRHCRTAAMARSFNPLGRPAQQLHIAHRSVTAHHNLEHDLAFEIPHARFLGVAGLYFLQQIVAA